MKGVGVAAVAGTITTAILFFVWSIGGQSSQAGSTPFTRPPNVSGSGCPPLHNPSETGGAAGVSCIDDYTFATLVDCIGISADNTFEVSQAFAQLNAVAHSALQNVSTPVNQMFSQLACPPYNGTDTGSFTHIQQVVASLGEQLTTLAQEASQPVTEAGLQRALSGGMDLSASAATTLRDGLTALAMLLALQAMGVL